MTTYCANAAKAQRNNDLAGSLIANEFAIQYTATIISNISTVQYGAINNIFTTHKQHNASQTGTYTAAAL